MITELQRRMVFRAVFMVLLLSAVGMMKLYAQSIPSEEAVKSQIQYVEYLETDGSEIGWNTGVELSSLDEVVYFDFMPLNGTTYYDGWYVFLCGENIFMRTIWGGYRPNGYYGISFGNAGNKDGYYETNSFSAGTKYECVYENDGITINGTRTSWNATDVYSSIAENIFINAMSNMTRCAVGRYYGFKIMSGNTVIIDLRPAIDGNDVPCFYDEVSGGYVYHTGSGTPLSGPAIPQVTSFVIKATPSPVEGGTVSGAGTYLEGAECTLTATAATGYTFVNWTENGEVVTSDEEYTFTVTNDRELIANFVVQSNNPMGAIYSVFSVSDNTTVCFSQGNLQYQASTNTWRFAENQWDYMDYHNEDISSVNSGWIDLFGYGTSGYNHGASCYQPWSNYTEGNAYYAYNLFDQTGQADWGYNPISNGGNTENMGWYTLAQEEWNFVFNTRNTPSGIRYAKAKVSNVNGVILLPDNWIATTYSLNNTNTNEASFSGNVISAEQWTTLEAAGAVFLPAAGRRWALTPNSCGSYGFYWSASTGNDNYSYIVYFRDNNLSTTSQITRSYGLSVRLVYPVDVVRYGINATPSPADGGSVSGAGTYLEGSECTLTAMANSGYAFLNWTENGEVVSTEAEYTFTVTEERALVANFVAIPPYFTLESLSDNNTITLSIPSGITSTQLTSVSYSTDGTNWTRLIVNSTNQSISVTLNNGEKVYLKGIGEQYGYEDEDEDEIYNCSFSATGDFNVYGNIMSLLYGDNFANKTSFPSESDYTFYKLFRGNTHLVSAENLLLPATSLASCCYECMFDGCTSLTTAPELPATTLESSCYCWMFRGCILLTTSPELPAAALASSCYYGMFDGCTSLTTAPVLPATTLVRYCYEDMFNGCTSLTTAPELPATALASCCYEDMFRGCTSLTSAPELPATSLASFCYYDMFYGCTSLTTAPELPATTLANYCYRRMFYNCSSLNEITCMATDISASNCTTDWLSGVASTGTFHKNPEMQDWPMNSPSGIPEGWTVLGNRYEVTAIANPIEGGTITGAGMYDQDETCTLTATPTYQYSNFQYRFVNWSENGEVFSTDNPVSFTVTNSHQLVANFEQVNYHWAAVTGMPNSMTILGILKIDGEEPYADYLEIGAFCGDECRGRALPHFISGYCTYALNVVGNNDGDPINFRLYDHHLGQELDLYCTNEMTFEDGAYYGSDEFYEFNFVSLVQITAIADPEEGGTVSGAGEFFLGHEITLTATASIGYTFINWTLESEVVSTDAEYTFEVSRAGDYVAHFSLNSYEITTTADPTEGGTVSGGGSYNHFATCTLTATAATGYTFQNWTLDGVEVSSDASYTFEVTSAANYVANFVFASYEIVAIASPSDGGVINGAGLYNHFSTCTLTATANEGYQFNSWLVDGATVSTETTYTFEVNGPVTFTALFEMVQSVELSQGWTWWGTSVEQSGIDGLGLLESSLNPNGRVIKTSDKFVQYNALVGWTGGLKSLTNEEGYRVQTAAVCTATVTGLVATPENHPITLNPNWTWIGYPVAHQQTVNEALSGFEPLTNDLIKSQGNSARYIPNVGWIPADFTLNPGESYMYYSKASDDKTLVYANGRSEVETKGDDRHWCNDIHAYADNLCLLAVVEIDGEEQRSEEIELGAFVNGECRGSARLMYVECFDRYYAMMNVMGETGDEVEFALIDRQRNMTSVDSPTHLTFAIDAIVGEFDDPFVVSFGQTTSLDESFLRLGLYPNPVNRNVEFHLLIPDDETVSEWTVVNALGTVVRQEKGAVSRQVAEGLPVLGVYVVRVVCKSGNVYQNRLVVK